ncbi:TVP38/TMEM64 family protein, partial [bacterium]|nr:TVP38/TMEM64 family protein [bacterium]
ISNIPLKQYALGSFVGMIPGTALFVYFGESLRMFSVINIVFAVSGLIALTFLGKAYEKRF